MEELLVDWFPSILTVEERYRLEVWHLGVTLKACRRISALDV